MKTEKLFCQTCALDSILEIRIQITTESQISTTLVRYALGEVKSQLRSMTPLERLEHYLKTTEERAKRHPKTEVVVQHCKRCGFERFGTELAGQKHPKRETQKSERFVGCARCGSNAQGSIESCRSMRANHGAISSLPAPTTPCTSAQCCSVCGGVRNEEVQFTTVLPPTARPCSTAMPLSLVLRPPASW